MQNQFQTASFADLFKKYRLRSQINTLAQFANLLAEEGMVYENSLFSRWQSGDRVPHDRKTIIAVIRVFAKQGGMRDTTQADMLLASSDQLPLTDDEAQLVHQSMINSKASTNELVEFDNVQNALPEATLEILNLAASTINYTFAKNYEMRVLSYLSKVWNKIGNVKINRSISFLSAFLIVIFCWWIGILSDGSKSTNSNYIFGLTYSFLPILAGAFGLANAFRWGGAKSSMGRALFYLSFGLITWGLGQVVWSYYVLVLKVEVPYPCLADLLFVTSWPLWGIGIYHIAKAAGIKYKLSRKSTKIQMLIVPIVMMAFSYYLLIIVARNGVLIGTKDFFVAFFDLIYPFMDALLVTEILLVFGLTYKQLHTRYKTPLSLLFMGVIANYIADFAFSFTNTNDTYYNGALADMLFIVSLFMIGVAVNSFEAS